MRPLIPTVKVLCSAALLFVATAAFAKKAEPFSAVIDGDAVTITWTVPAGLKYQEVMRDTDADPKGRQRVKAVRPEVTEYKDQVPEAKGEYFYWIKQVAEDGKITNLGPVKATKARKAAK